MPAKFGVIVANLVSRRAALEEAADVGFLLLLLCAYADFWVVYWRPAGRNGSGCRGSELYQRRRSVFARFCKEGAQA